MTLQRRDKRALAILGGALAIFTLYWALTSWGGQTASASANTTIPVAKDALARVQKRASGAEGRAALLKKVSAELAERERGLIQADTPAQAQAQLMDIIRRVARSQAPPLDFGTMEIGQQIAKLGDDYGEVQVAVPFTCQMDQLVNFLADLSKQPEALATNEIKVLAGDPKQKTVNVRLAIAGVVPKRLVPVKKGLY